MQYCDQWLSINERNTFKVCIQFGCALHRICFTLVKYSGKTAESDEFIWQCSIQWSGWAVKMHVMSRAMCCLFNLTYIALLGCRMFGLWSQFLDSNRPLKKNARKSFKNLIGNLLIYTQSKWHSFYGSIWCFVDSKCAISFVHALKTKCKILIRLKIDCKLRTTWDNVKREKYQEICIGRCLFQL